MKNEEVKIRITADAKPFQQAMREVSTDISKTTKNSEDFVAVIQNANKMQLRNIASSLKQEIKETTADIKNLQQQLIIAQSTDMPIEKIQGLRNQIKMSTDDLNILNNRLKQVNKTGNFSTLSSGLELIKKKLKDVSNGAERVAKKLAKWTIRGALFAAFGTIRRGFSDAISMSEIATNKFGAMRSAISAGLVPVVEGMARAFQKAYVWVAGLINFLSGGKINIIQNAINKVNANIKKTGDNAKKAGKKIKNGLVGSFDEINDIGSSGSDGVVGGLGVQADEVGVLGELSNMLDQMNALDFSWAEPIKSVLSFIKENGDILLVILGSLALAIGFVNIAMWLLSANPIVLFIAGIILLIGTLIAIIIVVVKHWDSITEAIGRFVSSAIESISGFIDGVISFFAKLPESIGKIIQSIVDWIVQKMIEGGQFIANIPIKINEAFTKAREFIYKIFGNIGKWFGDRITEIINFFKSLPGKVMNVMQNLWNKITGLFKKIGTVVGDSISGAVRGAVNSVLKGAVGIINGFINAINLAIKIINKIPGVKITVLKKLDVPSFDVGTPYVPRDMIAQIHKGERIVPAKYNHDDYGSNDMTETNALLETLIDVVYSKNLSIDESTIGRASVNYIKSERRLRGDYII